jgi:hypothetical protein
MKNIYTDEQNQKLAIPKTGSFLNKLTAAERYHIERHATRDDVGGGGFVTAHGVRNMVERQLNQKYPCFTCKRIYRKIGKKRIYKGV